VEKIAQDSDAPETDYQHHQDALRGVFRSTTPINLIGGVMMRRDLIGQTRFRTDLFIGEDFYFIYENLIKGADAVFLKQKWYYCRFHATNSSFNYTYDAFWSRFYRRELVWKNEEAMGRIEHVKLQKRDAVSVFVRCLVQNKPNSEDTKKMCRTMKDYRRALFPALSLKGKIACLLAIYAPAVYFRIHKLYHDLRRKRKR
jgi:hypothetical protein